MSEVAEQAVCLWCVAPLPPAELRCLACGQRVACQVHPQELVSARCEGCGRRCCARCLRPGLSRCRDCPLPAPHPDAPAAATGPATPAASARPAPEAHYELGRIVSWVAEDPTWISKVALGGLCLIGSPLILPMLLLLGYKVRIARAQRAAPGPGPLPDWSDPGELLRDGLVHWAALMAPAMIPALLIASLVGVGALLGATGALRGAGAGIAVVLLFMIGYVGSLAMGLVYFLLLPAIELEYLERSSVFAGLNLRSIWHRLSRAPGDYLMLWLSFVLLNFLANMGLAACGVGILVSIPYTLMAQGCLLGRFLAREDLRRERGDLLP